MRKLLIPAALIVSLAGGSAALAATKPAPAPAAAMSAAPSKAADCAKQWKAQKKHTQTRKAFLTACEKA